VTGRLHLNPVCVAPSWIRSGGAGSRANVLLAMLTQRPPAYRWTAGAAGARAPERPSDQL